MARYTGADCKRCRREKVKLFLKGAKCESPKCPIEIRPYPPGEHGRGRTKDSEYLPADAGEAEGGAHLRRAGEAVPRLLRGSPAQARQDRENLLRILESRLDNVVYRGGFAKSRDMARQLVRHGHITVNGTKVDIPSYRVAPNDIVEVRPSSVELTPFVVAAWRRGTDRSRVARGDPGPDAHPRPHLPARQVIDTPVQEQLIVELYSK